MRALEQDGGGLAELHRLSRPEDRAAAWRRGLATLASATAEQRPVPLEGVDPEQLLSSTRVALDGGLLEDLSFLSPEAAAAALYELASALPQGDVRRELGRQVYERMVEGNAPTFVALATSLAVGSRRGFEGAGLRARVALSLAQPIGQGPRVDALALALVSRPELQNEWLNEPATGSLPSRRLAARLLERAAREAALRARHGDDSGLRVFGTPTVGAAFIRLLRDRESLVWRHAATARGLLSVRMPTMNAEVHASLDTSLGATEWRRAAASLVASIAEDRRGAYKACRELIAGPLMHKDPGIPGAMILGLPRVAEAEPDLAEKLLEPLVKLGGIYAAESLAALLREDISLKFGLAAAQTARQHLIEARSRALQARVIDDGHVARIENLIEELSEEHGNRPRIVDRVRKGLQVFTLEGAEQAYRVGEEAVLLANNALRRLEQANENTAEGRRQSFRTLMDLDSGLLESSSLHDLLTLKADDQDDQGNRPLGRMYERLTLWLLARERSPLPATRIDHFTLRMRRTRALLHLVDAEDTEQEPRSNDVRPRRMRTVRMLLRRVANDAPSSLSRVVCATIARGCDALIREEAFELSDVLLAAAWHVRDPRSLKTLSEASMVPDVERSLEALSELVTICASAGESLHGRHALLRAQRQLIDALPPASSPRASALRLSLLRVALGLEHIVSARCQAELAGTWDGMADALHSLALLCRGAERRLGVGEVASEVPHCARVVRSLGYALDKAVSTHHPEALADLLLKTQASLRADLPAPFAELTYQVLRQLLDLPERMDPSVAASGLPPAPPLIEAPLPDWLPPSRTMGGFFVERVIGDGAGGSVFAAVRIEERDNPRRKRMALKVPTYDGDVARALSEKEFMKLFREEAGALLSLPRHPNLAGFITFDAGALPRPVLVMELVEGPSLERLIVRRSLSMEQAFVILEDISQGLEAMHSEGIGHLDLKPGNVIVRNFGRGKTPVPVLVDFGLSGRRLRPGCATENYGAPEIWGAGPDDAETDPRHADIYALGCLAFELITGRMLFPGPSGMAMVAAHVSHDGAPEPLQRFYQHPQGAVLAQWLSTALRQDPDKRADLSAFRRTMQGVREHLGDSSWPLGLARGEVALGA